MGNTLMRMKETFHLALIWPHFEYVESKARPWTCRFNPRKMDKIERKSARFVKNEINELTELVAQVMRANGVDWEPLCTLRLHAGLK
jgi:hypothetical protein